MSSKEMYEVSRHFAARFKTRFCRESKIDMLHRISKLKKPTKKQINIIKRNNHNAQTKLLMVSGNMAAVVNNNVLVSCWVIYDRKKCTNRNIIEEKRTENNLPFDTSEKDKKRSKIKIERKKASIKRSAYY